MYAGAAVEAFLASLEGGAHFVEMPHHRPSITGTSIAITEASSGVYTVATSDITGAAVGAWCRSGTRNYIITSVTLTDSDANTDLTLWPERPLTTSDTLAGATTIRVRARGTVPMPRIGRGYGPWVLPWEEAG